MLHLNLRNARTWTLLPALCAGICLAAPAPGGAAAQELTASAERAIERDALDLRDAIVERPADPDFVDTALVFQNTRRRGTAVRCVGYDDQGKAVGRVAMKIPARGLRYVRASDISNDRDFIGSVTCRTQGRVLGSVVLLGNGLTDLRVVQDEGGNADVIRFPLVAHF